eukprot:4943798-Karenia_brevis.AAC.1
MDKDKVDARLTRPGGGVMFITGSAVIRRVGMMSMDRGPFSSNIYDDAMFDGRLQDFDVGNFII